jgi:hypothetical protein
MIFPEHNRRNVLGKRPLSGHKLEKQSIRVSNKNLLSGHFASLTILVLLMSGWNSPLAAQIVIHDQWDIIRYYQHADWNRHINYFPSFVPASTDSTTDNAKTRGLEKRSSWKLMPIYINSVHNGRYASGYNYGPAWQGRGINTTYSAGIAGRIGRLQYVFNPYLVYNQNRAYRYSPDTLNTPPYQYAFSNDIDYVMRYGDNSRIFMHPGQSAIELGLEHVTFTLSTMNFRWGPSVYNPTLMSTNAPGFPHLRIGTTKPVSTLIGDLEANAFWGLLRPSGYQASGSTRDATRYFSAISLGYEPSFFPGFRIGFNRASYTRLNYLENFWRDGFVAFAGFSNPDPTVEFGSVLVNDTYDHIASLSFQYRAQDSPLTFYLDFIRGDYATSLIDLLRQPEHNSGYVMGMFQVFPIDNRNHIRLIFEYVNLAAWETANIRDSGSLYVHYINTEGYTNYGQVMGAGVGPGSSAYNVQLTWGRDQMSTGPEYYRTRFNDDYFYLNFIRPENPPQDIEHKVGWLFTNRWDNFVVDAAVYTGIRVHYLYDVEQVFVNMHSKLTFRYYFD